jgi:phosphohistidine phosphatase SixA
VEGVVMVDVIDMVWRARIVDIPTADQHHVAGVLADVAGLRRWLDGVEVACARRLETLAAGSPSLFPEHVAARATRSSLRRATRTVRRASTADQVAEIGAALAAGEISGEHVDAVTAGLEGLQAAQRALLAGHGATLARLASELTPDEFRRQVTKLVHQVQADDCVAKLQRQKRAVRLRTWVDKQSGMTRLSGEFDPEAGARLINQLNDRLDSLFRGKTPDDCPADPLARQDFLRAHALLDLINRNNTADTDNADGAGAGGPGADGAGGSGDGCPGDDGSGTSGVDAGGGGRVELCVTIDLRTIVHGYHTHSRVDFGIDGIDLPLDTLRRMAQWADIIPVLLDDDGVVLKMGRTRRLATRDQRRALRAMYRTCAIPGCTRPVRQCEPHHCNEWDPGGLTDIELLAPICKHHHDIIHTKHWTLTLAPDRSLTVTDHTGSVIMATGPPAEQWT